MTVKVGKIPKNFQKTHLTTRPGARGSPKHGGGVVAVPGLAPPAVCRATGPPRPGGPATIHRALGRRSGEQQYKQFLVD